MLLYASKYHDINTVINISGRFNLKEGIEERLGKDVMQKVKEDGFVDVRNNEGNVPKKVVITVILVVTIKAWHWPVEPSSPSVPTHIRQACHFKTVSACPDRPR